MKKYMLLLLVLLVAILLGYKVYALYAPDTVSDLLSPIDEITCIYVYEEGQNTFSSAEITEIQQEAFLTLAQNSPLHFSGIDPQQTAAADAKRYWIYISSDDNPETTTLVLIGDHSIYLGSKKYQLETTDILAFVEALEPNKHSCLC